MKDETYTFIQTVKDRKSTARGARYKKNGSKSRKCTLPSDYLTPKQIKERNSPMSTYTMNKPHTKAELRAWPRDLQIEYMAGILDKYHPTNADLGLMLGVHPHNACTYINRLGLSNQKRATESQAREFSAFLAADSTPTPDPAPAPDPAPETAQDEPAATIIRDTTVYTSLSLTFTGTVQDLLRTIITGPLSVTTSGTYTFTVTAERQP